MNQSGCQKQLTEHSFKEEFPWKNFCSFIRSSFWGWMTFFVLWKIYLMHLTTLALSFLSLSLSLPTSTISMIDIFSFDFVFFQCQVNQKCAMGRFDPVDSVIWFLLCLSTMFSSQLASDENHEIFCVHFLRWLLWKWSIVIVWFEWLVKVQGLDRMNSIHIHTRLKIDIDRNKKKSIYASELTIFDALFAAFPLSHLSSTAGFVHGEKKSIYCNFFFRSENFDSYAKIERERERMG